LILSRYDSGSDKVRPVPKLEDMIAAGIPCSVIHFNKEGEVTKTEDYNLENIYIDKYRLEGLARALLPQIIEFYEDPANVAAFERWQAERRAKGIPPSKPTRRRTRGRK